MEMIDSRGVEALHQLHDALEESTAVEQVAITQPIQAIENRLSEFVQDSFNCIRENREFEQTLQSHIESRLPEATFQQLVKLLEVRSTGNVNDTNAIVAPFAQVQSSRYQADAAAGLIGASGAQTAAKADTIYKEASKDILQGAYALNQLIAAAKKASNGGSPADGNNQ